MRKGKSNFFVAVVAAACAASACASDFEDYSLDGSFSLPPVGSGSFLVAFDPLPDGRLLAVTGNEVYVQQSIGGSDFDIVAQFDVSQSGGASDPAFVHLSPDGSQVAAGLGFGKPVVVFNVADLGTPGSPTTLTSTTAGGTTRYFSVDHWEAAWFDEQYLALTVGVANEPSLVTLLDVSSDVADPFNPVVLNDIRGSSAGIAFDAQDGLYTGNGFDFYNPPGPSITGTIRRFALSEWHDVLSGGTPADFEFDGQFVADLLSAASLGFDAEGNLFAGGGDLFGGGQFDFFALVGSVALADALAGSDPITLGDPTEVRQFDPDPSPYSFYSVCYNPALREIYAASGTTCYRYAVPEPATGVMVILLLTMLRRRR